MRRIVLNAFVIVLSALSVAQDITDWKSFAEDEITSSPSGEVRIFLIEGSMESIRDHYFGNQILRSIDRNHHIIKGKYSKGSHRAWSVNDQWKLNLSETPGSSFYVVTSRFFDQSKLEDIKVIKRYPDNDTYLIRGPFKKIESVLLHDPEVIHITNKVFTPFVESRVIDMNLNPNRVNKIHHHFPLLDGSSEIVSIQENSFDRTDIDLLNRSVSSGLESKTVDNHATEMATIIAGAGNSFITGRGVARKARLISSDFFDAMPDADSDYQTFGINTQNHSYGIPRANEYGVEARAFDQSAFNNKNLLHVFSSGNEGLEVSSEGIYAGVEGYANLTGNIKMSKNALVVGSVDTVGLVPDFVSRGPAYDGRVKPEVVAYSVAGSSNSAALASGVAVLLQQQYREDNLSEMPSALVKALLINGAEDVGPQGLDFVTGYGNINAWNSLRALQNNQFYRGEVTDGDLDSFMLEIPSNALNLKVTLCWTDLPANVNDFLALVNNLDLRLVNGAEVTHPWILDETPDNLSNASVRGVDQLNNAEQVTIENPELSYTIEVAGSSVSEMQEFYVTWQYDIADSFEWDFPTASDNMPYNGESGSYFRWSTTKTGIATLAYSNDDINWIVLDENVDLQSEYWRWNNPPDLDDDVRARLEVGGEVFETDLFTVSQPLSTSVGFNCGDSLMLKWDYVQEAVDYTVFTLGNELMQEYQVTSDTFLIIQDKDNFQNPFFSIRPNLSPGKSLLPSPAFDYSIQGIDCYIFSFFQTVESDTGIYLNLSLGTTYGIDQIILERNNVSGFETIQTISNPDNELIEYLDEYPNQGYNEHRAVIYFLNGEILTMSSGSSFYLTDEPIRIAPNPIQSGEQLFVLTREFDDPSPVFSLTDHKGVVVYSQILQGTQNFIPTIDFPAGLYFYRLSADGQEFNGRVLIR